MTVNKQSLNPQKRPIVIFDYISDNDATKTILEKAEEFNWRIMNLSVISQRVPTNPELAGMILTQTPSPSLITTLKDRNIPMVLLAGGRDFRPDDIPTLLRDSAAIGRLGAQHFIDRGYKHFAFFGSHPWGFAKAYYDSYIAAAEKAGGITHLYQMKIPKGIKEDAKLYMIKALAKWLKELPKPVGIMTGTDSFATRLAYACEQAQIKVPEDVAILGVGNIRNLCEFASLPISSIDTNLEKRNTVAMDLLHDLIQGKAAPDGPVYIKPAGVVARRSTDLLAVDHPKVAQALRFIWDHLSWPLTIDDVANEVGISRRSITSTFKKYLGRSIQEEIQRKRLEKSRQLLHKTDMNLSDICHEAGFQTLNNFHKVFKKELGMTPAEYRKSKQSG